MQIKGGNYVYIEATDLTAGSKHKLQSPDVMVSGTYAFCLSFWYSMYGSGMGSLAVYSQLMLPGGREQQIWLKSGDQGNQWFQAQVTIPATGDYMTGLRVTFEATRGGTYQSDIALDDISLSRQACNVVPATTPSPPATTQPPVPVTFQCGFEDSEGATCGIQQDASDNFDWTRQSGTTSSAQTGPIGTWGGNNNYYYMFTEVSPESITSGSQAKLLTPYIGRSQSQSCFSMYTHMYGSSIGSLRVYFEYSGGFTKDVFTISGNQGNQWVQQRFTVTHSMSGMSFRAVIVGTAGPSYQGDIAIDDIFISNGPCSGVVPTPSPPTPPPGTGLRAFSCNFNNDLCPSVFRQASDDQRDWERYQGQTKSGPNTGPQGDVEGSGYYIYLEASNPAQTNDQAKLVATVDLSQTRCLSFAYHMKGLVPSQTMGTLEVRVGGAVVWSKSGNQGANWQVQSVTLQQRFGAILLEFVAIRGPSWASDIAVDNISLRAGSC